MSTARTPGPVCRLPSGRIVGCEYINGDPATSQPHSFGCECDRCEPELAAKREHIRDAAPDLLAALREIANLESEIGDAHRYRYAAIARAAIAKAEGDR